MEVLAPGSSSSGSLHGVVGLSAFPSTAQIDAFATENFSESAGAHQFSHDWSIISTGDAVICVGCAVSYCIVFWAASGGQGLNQCASTGTERM